MRRCASGLLLTLVILFVGAFTGCLGKSSGNSGNGGISTVSLNPGGIISLDIGTTQPFTAAGKYVDGKPVIGLDIQFVVGVPAGATGPSPLSITNGGNACAGTWDISGAICSPGGAGIATVMAVINGTSSAVTTVYVHQHIDSVQIVSAEAVPPQYECFSQGQTWVYQAIAYSDPGNVDITNTVGPMSWSSSNAGVVTLTPIVVYPNPQNQENPIFQIQTTAKGPGITQLSAGAAGTSSNPFPYTTCLIKAIYLQIGGQGQAGNSITVDNGGSIAITATAVDTLYGVANTTALTSPPLTWSTTHPEVAAFGTTTTNTTGNNSATARNNLGGATLTASCSPPTCNIGVVPSLPVYASDGLLPNGTPGFGEISVDVTSTSAVPTYTAWVATTDCQDAPGCSSALFKVTPGTNPISSITGLPRTPNSMMFNHLVSPRIYFGSDQGLMYVSVSNSTPSVTLVSNSSIPCNVSLCGKVLTISNDGQLVVVADTVSTPGQIYIYNGSTTTSSAPVDLILPNSGEIGKAAAFSPDRSKVFILTNLDNMYIYSTVDALTSVSTFAPATDVEFSADGSFAYVAGAPDMAGAPASSVSAFSTCSLPTVGSVNIGSVATSATPLNLFPSPLVQADLEGLTQTVLALEPPNVQFLTAQFTQDPVLYKAPQLQLTCNPPQMPSFTAGAPVNLGQGNFDPVYSQLVNDGTQLIIVARHLPAVLIFNVSDGTTVSVPLVDNPAPPDPLSASASTDGSQVYVASCDQYPNNDPTQPCGAGSVHIVNTISGGDFQQVPYTNINDNNNPNMCNNQGGSAPLCLPNLIAIRPQ